MLELPLHAGTEHANLFWIAIPSLLSFAAGLGLGLSQNNRTTETQPESVSEPEQE